MWQRSVGLSGDGDGDTAGWGQLVPRSLGAQEEGHLRGTEVGWCNWSMSDQGRQGPGRGMG